MSVLIKGIGIPNSCAECRFCVNGFTDEAPMYECACESYENVSVLVDDHGKPFDFRPDWCPLIEVPPYGDLIDRDNLLEKAYYDYNEATHDYNKFRVVLEDDIIDAPTVIEGNMNRNGVIE